ncbi:hypothetical protein, partial [Photorhabdus hindustanensis]
ITESVPASIGEQLTALIERDDDITSLNIIRTDQKDFQYTAVKTEVDKALLLENLYIYPLNLKMQDSKLGSCH